MKGRFRQRDHFGPAFILKEPPSVVGGGLLGGERARKQNRKNRARNHRGVVCGRASSVHRLVPLHSFLNSARWRPSSLPSAGSFVRIIFCRQSTPALAD